MSESSYEESDEENDINIVKNRLSINNIRSKNNLIMHLDPHNNKKRSSSASINLPINFVPKLKPIKAKYNPSPIILNEKPPPKKINEEQNRTISTCSFDSKNEIKLIRKLKEKKSFKLIDEKIQVYSDFEEENKNKKNVDMDSDSSKNDEDIKNNIKLRSKPKLINIERMRLKMTKIRKNFVNENILDDSNIRKSFIDKTFKKIKNINIIMKKIRNNKKRDLYSLNIIKSRNKSFNAKNNYIPTILGFLERNKSDICLKSKGS